MRLKLLFLFMVYTISYHPLIMSHSGQHSHEHRSDGYRRRQDNQNTMYDEHHEKKIAEWRHRKMRLNAQSNCGNCYPAFKE